MSYSVAEEIFLELVEEAEELGDIIITERDDDGFPTHFHNTDQGRAKFETDLAVGLQVTVAQYLQPENCN